MKKILVVDDDWDILDAMETLLSEEGYVCQTTPRGEEVEEKVKSFLPDYLVIDILLSGTDGRDIVKHLRSLDEAKSLKILMVSAHLTAGEGVGAVGADCFLGKPFEVDRLLDVLKGM